MEYSLHFVAFPPALNENDLHASLAAMQSAPHSAGLAAPPRPAPTENLALPRVRTTGPLKATFSHPNVVEVVLVAEVEVPVVVLETVEVVDVIVVVEVPDVVVVVLVIDDVVVEVVNVVVLNVNDVVVLESVVVVLDADVVVVVLESDVVVDVRV